MRESAAEKAFSAWASAGTTTLLSSAESANGPSPSSSAAPAARRISSAVILPWSLRQFVAAARSADALQNALADQRLQHRLEMPRRQMMTSGQCLSGNRTAPRIERDVDDGCDREDAFARQ